MSKKFKRIRNNLRKQKKKEQSMKNQAIQNFEKRSSENKQPEKNIKSSSATGSVKSFSGRRFIPCHDVTEICRNLFIGGINSVSEMILDKQVDVLVPLDSLDGNIWDLGFRGEILYYPIRDFGTLPYDVYCDLIDIIYQKLYLENKKVGLFCLGGHGRTGYVACGVLGKLGYADPIAQIRKVYCNSAVESNSQIKQIAKYCHAPSLETKYYIDEFQGFGRGYMNWRYGSGYSYYDDYDNYSPSITPIHGSLKNDKKEGDKLKDEEYWDDDGIEDPEILQMEILKMEEQEMRAKKSFGNTYTNPYRISK